MAKTTPVEVNTTNVGTKFWKSVKCGYQTCIALASDATTVVWGLGTYGTGDGTTSNNIRPVLISRTNIGPKIITSIAQGMYHGIVLTSDGLGTLLLQVLIFHSILIWSKYCWSVWRYYNTTKDYTSTCCRYLDRKNNYKYHSRRCI